MPDDLDPAVESQVEIFKFIENVDAPVVTTQEVASDLNGSISEAQEKLRSMAADGMLKRKVVGENIELWWPTDRPDIDPQTRALLLRPEQEDPLDLEDIKEIVDEYS